MSFENNDQIRQGEVELDETFVGGKNKNRHKSKKVKNSQGRSYIDKQPVLGMLNRGGRVLAKAVDNTSQEVITPVVLNYVKKEMCMVYTDEWYGYRKIAKMYHHLFVTHGTGEYVKGRVHTNTMEGFWSWLKRGILGIYHSMSRKHIQKYLDEYVFRYNLRKMTSSQRFNLVLQYTDSTRIRYKDLVGLRR